MLDKRIAFILPPKTGTRSIEHVIRGQLHAVKRGTRHSIDKSVIDAADVVVASIRNPFDVIVSWYHFHGAGEKVQRGFEDWLEYIWADPQNRVRHLEYSTLPYAEHATEYIRYEEGLAEQLNQFLVRHGYPKCEVPHTGKCESRQPWPEYYTPEIQQRVLDRYGQDFKRYGYTSEISLCQH